MMCAYCGKARCVHRDLQNGDYIAAVEAKRAQPVTLKTRRPPLSGSSLFQQVGLRDLECVLCRYCVPVGAYQPALRFQHGMLHVSRGEAVAVRRGMPPGVVRFQVAKDTT